MPFLRHNHIPYNSLIYRVHSLVAFSMSPAAHPPPSLLEHFIIPKSNPNTQQPPPLPHFTSAATLGSMQVAFFVVFLIEFIGMPLVNTGFRCAVLHLLCILLCVLITISQVSFHRPGYLWLSCSGCVRLWRVGTRHSVLLRIHHKGGPGGREDFPAAPNWNSLAALISGNVWSLDLALFWQWFRFFPELVQRSGWWWPGTADFKQYFPPVWNNGVLWPDWSADVMTGRGPFFPRHGKWLLWFSALFTCADEKGAICRWKARRSVQQHECEGCAMQWAGALPSTLVGRTAVPAGPLPASQCPHGQVPHPQDCSHVTWGFWGYSLNFKFPAPLCLSSRHSAYLTCLFLSSLPQQSISFWGQEFCFCPLAFCVEIMPNIQ